MARRFNAGLYDRLETDTVQTHTATKQYSVGIYARVSVEDNRSRGNDLAQSGSVENQVEMLTAYAEKMGWPITKVYTDDGWSGSTCERPAFQEMMGDVRAREINLILCKDMSRFGRNSSEVNRYIEFLFPAFHCRLVAPEDQVDTLNDDNDMMYVYNLLNDLHLKDLSEKIKASHRSMAHAGKRVAGRPPYGYRIDPSDKHKFLIDDYATVVVKRIFEMRLQNIAYGRIAGILNNEGILSPRLYEYEHNGKLWPYKTKPVWLVKAVKDILRNPAYLGHRVQLRNKSISYRVQKSVARPEDEWVRVENCHPAVVDQDIWDAVQVINERAGAAQKKAALPTPSLFRGLLRCADCGGSMSPYNNNHTCKNGITVNYRAYYCSRHALTGYQECSSHRIREDDLKQLVLEDIQKQAARAKLSRVKMVAELQANLNTTDSVRNIAAQLNQLSTRLKKLDRKQAQLYEDKVSGIITEQTFSTLIADWESEYVSAQNEQINLLKRQTEQQKTTQDISQWMELIVKHDELLEINRALLEELVERIEVGETTTDEKGTSMRKIRIFYRHIGEA